MHSSSADLIHMLHEHRAVMVAQLHQLVEINTSTFNLPGLKLMTQALRSAFIPIADQVQTLAVPDFEMVNMAGDTINQPIGDVLYIQKRPKLKRRILLCGHMDTVYSANSSFQTITTVDDNTLKGPGVSDMKGGLIVMLHALKAFEKTPFAKELGWDVFISADEEIGSPQSAALLKKYAPRYQAALVYEPATNLEGDLAKNRKGSGKFTLIATGKQAHAGRSFSQGRNAIVHLARALVAIDALNGKRKEVTLNIGKIAGGEALNIVPNKAVAKIDIRIHQPEDEQWVKESLEKIMKNQEHPDYQLHLIGEFRRPVKTVSPGTKILFKQLQAVGNHLGLTLNWHDSGGCCDGNNLSDYGLPVLDTLGVRGGDIHSDNEFILLDSLSERAALSALLLVDLAQGGLEALA